MSSPKFGRGRRDRRPSNPSSTPVENGARRPQTLSEEIVVNVSNRETRIALLEDGKLTEYRVEREERVVGSIFKGIVQNVLPGMDAAFVDIGLERNAYLSLADVMPEEGADNSPSAMRRTELRRRKIKDLLRPGQQVMVQVTKGPRGTKGARVSTRIALPGRSVVLMPEAGNVGVSRKIEERGERDRLKRIGEKIQPDGFGIIMRTECEGRTEADLKADVDYLVGLWDDVLKSAKKLRAPVLVHKDQSLLFRTLRDQFGETFSRMTIDDPDEYEKVHLVASIVSPHLTDRIQLYDKDEPIFDEYGIEKELDRLMKHKVPLKSGGSLVIDEMEALTAIDVNTGKQVGSTNLEDTVLKANIEACDEILRQLRLRDMGGIIVCDFIDMEAEGARKQVLDRFSAGLEKDRARTRVGRVSSLGLVEVTRKRTGESVTQELTEICPMCAGGGSHPFEGDGVALDRAGYVAQGAGAGGRVPHRVQSGGGGGAHRFGRGERGASGARDAARDLYPGGLRHAARGVRDPLGDDRGVRAGADGLPAGAGLGGERSALGVRELREDDRLDGRRVLRGASGRGGVRGRSGEGVVAGHPAFVRGGGRDPDGAEVVGWEGCWFLVVGLQRTTQYQ